MSFASPVGNALRGVPYKIICRGLMRGHLAQRSERESTMPTIEANGSRLSYESTGAGEPILLISGFACDHLMWGKIAPRLAKKYRVVTYDNRGTGESSDLNGPCSIRDLADDATRLMDAVGIKKAHVAGHSMGGMIVQELALAYPERVQSLVLLASCAKCDERGKAIIEMFGDMPRLVDPPTSARLIMPWLYTNSFYSTPGAVASLVKWLLECPSPPTAQAMYHQSRAISACDTTSRLGAIRCPTLVLAGDEDILLPVSFSKELAQAIAGAKLVVLPGTGHGMLIETPEQVVAAMIEFLS
jgi:3-oxoadipate enol-lactonase